MEAIVDLLFLVQVAESTNAPLVPAVESLTAWGMHAAAKTRRYTHHRFCESFPFPSVRRLCCCQRHSMDMSLAYIHTHPPNRIAPQKTLMLLLDSRRVEYPISLCVWQQDKGHASGVIGVPNSILVHNKSGPMEKSTGLSNNQHSLVVQQQYERCHICIPRESQPVRDKETKHRTCVLDYVSVQYRH